MIEAPYLLVVIALVGGCCGVGLIFRGMKLRESRPSLPLAAVAVLPGFLMLVLFYSLALHMYMSLGGWPASIGHRGLPAALVRHGVVTGWAFTILFLASILVWPPVVVVCSLVSRWRGALLYLGLYAVACVVCFGNMLLAPEGFLYWWWD